jgi:very-short-patch-repair endonuclease
VREELTNAAHIARLAANQHGVVSVAQLDRLGFHRQSLTRRVRAQQLHRVHRGVYAVGHLGLNEKGWWMAAVLACGPDAVLSHTSAAALWELLPQEGFAHVTVPGNQRCRPRIRVHRSRTLFPSVVTRRAGIPVTTPSRTLADLRRLLPHPQFAAALRKAEFLGLRVDDRFDHDHTRSELEARFLALCRRHRLPRPAVNERVGGYVVDFLWPGQRLIVELDGYQAHRGRSAFEADRARDAELKLLGYEVLRFTWRRLHTEQTAVASAVRGLLTINSQ